MHIGKLGMRLALSGRGGAGVRGEPVIHRRSRSPFRRAPAARPRRWPSRAGRTGSATLVPLMAADAQATRTTPAR